MASEFEYALFSYLAYPVPEENRILLPTAWTQFEVRDTPLTGFSATVFKRGTGASAEYVIAYRGSAPPSMSDPDWAWTNIDAAQGWRAAQIEQSLELVADLQASGIDLSQISFTGHSLGGGLASVMAVFFDRPAVTFAAAPFEHSATDGFGVNQYTVNDYYQGYVAYLAGISGNTVGPDAEFTQYRLFWDIGFTPGRAEFRIREPQVRDYYTTSDLVRALEQVAGVPAVAGSRTELTIGTQTLSTVTNVSEYHDLRLAAALLASVSLRGAFKSFDGLMELWHDESLYGAKYSDTAKTSFSASLLRGLYSADAAAQTVIDRFAAEVLLLRQGAASSESLRRGLVATIMEHYYFAPASQTAAFANPDAASGAIRLDLTSLLANSHPLAQRGTTRLAAALAPYLSPGNQPLPAIVHSTAVAATTWHVNNTSGRVFLPAGSSQNEVVVGNAALSNDVNSGDGNDLLIGGKSADVFDAGAGSDVLIGGKGQDTLRGGSGFDTYYFRTGDGFGDVIAGDDNDGQIIIDDVTLNGIGARQISSDAFGRGTIVWRWVASGRTFHYVLDNYDPLLGGRLRIYALDPLFPAVRTYTSVVVVERFRPEAGDLGIQLQIVNRAALTSESGKNPFEDEAFDPSAMQLQLSEGGAVRFAAALNRAAIAGDVLTLSTTGAGTGSGILVGDQLLPLSSGSVSIPLTPGQSMISLALVSLSDIDTSETFDLVATLEPGANGGASTNAIANVGFLATAEPSPTTPTTTTTITYTGNRQLLGSAANDWVNGTTAPLALQLIGREGDNLIDGSAFSDFATGGSTVDRIRTGAGRDYVSAGGGNDTVEGGADADVLQGGPGNDIVFGDGEIAIPQAISDGQTQPSILERGDFVQGSDGDDTLVGAARGDLIGGGAGRDTLIGGAGNDFLFGDHNHDIVGAAPTALYNESVTGWRNWTVVRNQTTVGNVSTFSWTVTLESYVDPLGNPVSIAASGTPGEGDIIHAGAGNDDVVAGGGNDAVYGDDGDDLVLGEAGEDFIHGGAGNDWLDAGDPGNVGNRDLVDGGDGDDRIEGGGGNDTLFGGAGVDLIFGDDFDAEDGDDYVDGEDGNDTLIGGGGRDRIYGGAGNDTIEGDGIGTPTNLQLADHIDAEDGDDTARGGGGDDVIIGGAGNDSLYGDTSTASETTVGNDTLFGDAGVDLLVGGGGADRLYGGTENDQLWGDATTAGIPAGLAGIDELDGGDGDDQLVGGGEADRLIGGDGADTIFGDDDIARVPLAAHGADYIDGGAGDDIIVANGGDDLVFGGDGVDAINGDEGNDQLYGEAGQDTLDGGAGDDVLVGGAAADYLRGGAGNDVYILDGDDISVAGGFREVIDDTQGNNTILLSGAFDPANMILGAGAASGDVNFSVAPGYEFTIKSAFSGGFTMVMADGSEEAAHSILGRLYLSTVNRTDNVDDARLYGGAANDSLTVGGNNAELSGGRGNDTLNGSTTKATRYRFELGDGDDVVTDSGAAATANTFVFGEGVTLDDIRLEYNVTSFYLHYSATDSVRLSAFTPTNAIAGTHTVDQFSFADGTSISWADLVATKEILRLNATQGTNVNDRFVGNASGLTLEGFEGNDVLDGGTANDTLIGGAGGDTYVFGLGYGTDTVIDANEAGVTNRVEFGAGIAPSAARFVRYESDLIVKVAGTTDRLIITNFYVNGGVDQFRFADGTTLLASAIVLDSVSSQISGGDDDVYGTPNNDVIDALTGNDFVRGGSGDDTIEGNAGDDQLYGGAGNDTLTDATGTNSLFGDDGNDALTGAGTLDGGTGNDTILGAATNDTLVGGTGDDTLRGGAGNDSLDGGAGSDVFLYSLGDGKETINQSDAGTGRMDVVRLSAAIRPQDVILSANTAGDLLITFRTPGGIAIAGDEIRVPQFLVSDTSQTQKIDRIEFEALPGYFWSIADIERRAMMPTTDDDRYIRGRDGHDDVIDGIAGNDKIFGLGGNDTLIGPSGLKYGGNGDDVFIGGGGLNGEAGNDTFIVTSGSGIDGGAGIDTVVLDRTSSATIGSGVEVIRLASGILPSDIRFRGSSSNYGDLGIQVWDAQSSSWRSLVTIQGALVPNALVPEVRFVDDPGTVLTLANMRAPALQNASSDSRDTIGGFDTDDLIVGLGGDDSLSGAAGNDTLDGGTGNDSLLGEAGNDTLVGGAGNDTLSGGADVDDLDGGTGNDTLDGGAGNDVFRFNSGAGFDSIVDSGGVDRIQIGAGVTPAQAALYRQRTTSTEDSLFLVLNGSADQILVRNHFAAGGASAIEEIRFDDGTVWNAAIIAANVINLSGTANSQTGTTANNTFVVDHPSDTITEAANAGTDSVQSGVSFTLPNNVENLTLTGLLNIDASGNSLDNVLTGNAGANTLRGFGGADQLIGASGNDLYFIDGPDLHYTASEDTVIEAVNGGYDTVVGSVANYWLPANVEAFRLGTLRAANVSNAQHDFVGNDLDNLIEISLPGLSSVAGTILIDGGLGADTMIATIPFGEDEVTFVVDNPGDQIFVVDGGAVRASISYVLPSQLDNLTLTGTAAINGTGNARNNILTGNSANNILDGGAGNDTLNGGTGGADILRGGLGDDTYDLDRATGISLVELANEGSDTVRSSFTYTLSVDFENLTLTGSSDLNGTGNALDNVLLGNSGNNTLTGGDGNDTLDGFATGTDVLIGGLGNDVYIVSRATGLTLVENAGAGVDEIRASIDYTLLAEFENLTLTGSSSINGTGNSGNNVLVGNTGSNVLTGGAGDDTLDGGSAGNDTLVGGVGNDTYRVNSTANIAITELTGEGTDVVLASVNHTLAANVENLTLVGTAAINGTGNATNNLIIGNAADNALDGGAGADQMQGGAGDDRYVIDNAGDVVTELAGEGTDIVESSIAHTLAANVEQLILTGSGNVAGTGNSLNNWLIGNAGSNVLSGGAGDDVLDPGTAGTDSLVGGTGNDVYILTRSAGVSLTELAGEGTDEIRTSLSHTLATNFENITLLGSAAINANGNAVANVLIGNVANNILDGGAGADQMAGGNGDDAYVVDIAGDVITELASEGTDSVLSSVTFTLATNVENLTLSGSNAINATGNASDNVLVGNAGNNVLTGLDGNDTLRAGSGGTDTLLGGLGNDRYIIDRASGITVTENASQGTDTVEASVTYVLPTNVEHLTLTGSTAINGTGNTASNTIIGNVANNILNGGTGADNLYGGAGNDTYVVDNTSDDVFENASEGVDLVQSSVTFTLDAHIENLTLTGTGAINGTGNTLNNVLVGGSGNNTLDGGAGADQMTGGAGNDTYVVDDAGDVVTEGASAGTDLVRSSLSYTLGTNLENLTLIGVGAANGTGNTLDNVITGNAADNTLDGLAGNDRLDAGAGGIDMLRGGAGNDVYVVTRATGITLVELAGEGTDTVESTVTHTLAAEFENLTLTGSAVADGTGNAVANVLVGNSGDNVLFGLAGNDRLEAGSAGVDVLQGGVGDDLYVVTRATGITIVEASGEGIDTVESTVTHVLAAEVENLTITGSGTANGTGNALNNVITGNTGANTLAGGAGNDRLFGGTGGTDVLQGGAGDDTYVLTRTSGVTITELAGEGIDTVEASVTHTLAAEVENLTLTGTTAINATGNTLNNVLLGNSGNNTLTGSAGDDQLNGGAGTDTLNGGDGADQYFYASGGGADTINNTSADAAVDRLIFTNLARTALTFTRSVNDLIITRTGVATDNVRVTNWFSVTGNQIDFVETTGGVVTTAAEINALIAGGGSGFPNATFPGPEDWAMQMETLGFNSLGKRHTALPIKSSPFDLGATPIKVLGDRVVVPIKSFAVEANTNEGSESRGDATPALGLLPWSVTQAQLQAHLAAPELMASEASVADSMFATLANAALAATSETLRLPGRGPNRMLDGARVNLV